MTSFDNNTIKVAVFNTKLWVKESIEAISHQESDQRVRNYQGHNIRLTYIDQHLKRDTAHLASGHDVVSCFVNDHLDGAVLSELRKCGVGLIALRCAGVDNLDDKKAEELGITIVRVPAYSPYSVAEHAVALLMALNRNLHHAYNRVRENNFSLDGLQGFDMNGKTGGIIGTGKIGRVFAKILLGFGCRVLCYDVYPNKEFAQEFKVEYVELDQLLRESDFISLHAPLTDQTKHMINSEAISKMKKGVILINTSRGALIDTKALIQGLEEEKIGAAGLDVYENEREYFFEDKGNHNLKDKTLRNLLGQYNVILTGHQAFFTREALENIARETLQSIVSWSAGELKKEDPHVVIFGKK